MSREELIAFLVREADGFAGVVAEDPGIPGWAAAWGQLAGGLRAAVEFLKADGELGARMDRAEAAIEEVAATLTSTDALRGQLAEAEEEARLLRAEVEQLREDLAGRHYARTAPRGPGAPDSLLAKLNACHPHKLVAESPFAVACSACGLRFQLHENDPQAGTMKEGG